MEQVTSFSDIDAKAMLEGLRLHSLHTSGRWMMSGQGDDDSLRVSNRSSGDADASWAPACR